MQVVGSAIDRVLNPKVAPTSKFAGLIDTALALGLGSICAFGLTLGPAPLNTVAVSSAAAASLSAHLEPSPASPLLDIDADRDSPGSDASDASPASTASPSASPSASVGAALRDAGDSRKATAAPAPVEPRAETGKTEAPPSSSPPSSNPAPAQPAPLQRATADAALAIVEAHRLASGLAAFVSAEDCGQSTIHASVVVTPPGLLPSGLATKSLAPDPAFATAQANGSGSISVTIHACQ